MKKNKMMRLASSLLVAVLLTSSVISGTFAKYVTSETGTDTARVAKFGVKITANGETFAKEYATHDTNYAGTIVKSVVSTDKVVAPGTSGAMASMTLSGNPEVAIKVSYKSDFALSDNWTVAGGVFYCPLVIDVEGTKVHGVNYPNKAAFEEAVENLINGWTKAYDPGVDLSTLASDSVSVSWEWPFETGADAAAKKANNENDTWLGNQAAADNPATVTLTIETIVEQID